LIFLIVRKQRILLLSHYFFPHLGGIETVSKLLAEKFSSAGYDVAVVTWTKHNEKENLLYKVIRQPSVPALIKYFFWADVIVENNPCLRLSWPGFIIHKPNMVVLHIWIDHNSKKTNIQQRLKIKKLAIADEVVAISNAVRKAIWPQAVVIHDPFDDAVFNLGVFDVNREPDFIFVGRLVSDKGAEYAIKAIKKLICTFPERLKSPNPLLTIVGDGPERKNLEKLALELKIDKYIRFTGALNSVQIARELRQHKYLIVPSAWNEPFGIVALEGMACGCIPIVSNGGGLPEAIGDAGIIFEKKDTDSLFNAICTIENDILLQERAKRAATTHLQLHTAEKITNAYLQLIRKIIKTDS
jgi:glycosyltransferase involved in cell wall biosynthesis